MLCAGTYSGSTDTCQGDSGGPLVSYDEGTKRFYQRGIVSFGYGCGESKAPGGYSDVTRLMGWIHGVVDKVENENVTVKR